MGAALGHKKPLPPSVLEERFKVRTTLLQSLATKNIAIGPGGSESRRQELRHLLQDRNYHGEILPMVCDYCFTDLWQSKEDKIVSCPGCGWVS